MEATQNKTKMVVKEVVEWFFVILAVLFVLFVAIFASNKPTEKTSGSVFGFETRLVISGSMEAEDSYYKGKNYKVKKIETGSVVFIKSTPQDMMYTLEGPSEKRYTTKFKEYLDKINVGDVVAFVPESGSVNAITHRVVSKTEVNNKIRFETRGDVVDSENQTTTESFYAENLIGKVIGTSAFVGNLYRNVFTKKPVMAAVILIPSAIVIAVEGNKIAKIIKEDKAEKAAASSSAVNQAVEEVKKGDEE